MTLRPELEPARTRHLVQSDGEPAAALPVDFQLIVEQSPSLVLVTDSGGRVEYVNPRFCEVTGYAASEVVGRQIHELGELSPEQAGEIWATVSSGRTWRGDFQAAKKSGEMYWVSSCISPVTSPGGTVSQFVSTNIDITDIKRAEEELRQSDERLRAIAETNREMIWETDLESRVTFANQAVEAVLGYRPQDLMGLDCRPLIHPQDWADMGHLLAESVTALTGWSAVTARWKHADGSYHHLESTGVPVFDAEGLLVRFRGSARDVTERVEAEAALRESEGRFRALAETTTAAAFIFDGARIIYANPAAAAVTGYARDELEGMNFWEIVHPDVQDDVNEVARARATGDTKPVEVKLRRKGGELRWLEFSMGFVEYDGARRVLGTAFDITDRKAADKALNESRERLRLALDRGQMTAWEWDVERDRITDTAGEGGPLAPDPEPQTYGRFIEAVCDQDRDAVAAALRRAVADEGEFAAEFQMLWPDGQLHWVVTSGGLMVDADSGRKRLVGVAMDITERKAAESALRESEERYRSLYQDNPSMYFTVAEEGTVLSVNQFGAEQLGYTPDELVGGSVFEVFHKADRAAVKRQFAYLARDPSAVRSWEFRKVRKDGAVIWVREIVRASQDAAGQTIFLVVCEDISERRRMEETMQSMREELERRAERAVAHGSRYALSFREMTVVELVASGKSDKEIGVILGIRPMTVSKHVANVLKKMGAASRAEAGVRALREGIIN
jgi:PAS domain S-box-containing protein